MKSELGTTLPAVRVDGRCAVCPRKRRRPAKGHKSALEAWELDPFCSTECAKRFFGVAIRESAGHVLDDQVFDAEFSGA